MVKGWSRIAYPVIAFIAGCDGAPRPLRPSAVEAAYPVRSDWLVVSAPKATPTHWYAPGSPPLFALDRPNDALIGDDAMLLPELQTRAILNTKKFPHLEVEPRPFFQTGLDALFGTPAEPRVGMSAAVLEQSIAAKEADLSAAQAAQKEERESDLKALQARRPDVAAQEAIVAELGLDTGTLQKGGTLFRDYCQQCHGATGDGNGPGGRFLLPLPRDYRSGLFKFITTQPNPQGVKPRRADLYRTISNGLDGSAMPAFSALKSDEIEALVSYVIHLTIRGECEFQVMKVAADKQKAEDFLPANAEADLFEQLKRLLPVWQRSNGTPADIPDDPNTTADDRMKAAVRGHRVFLDATQGGCTACHADYGRGALLRFDEWGGITRPRNLTVATVRVSRRPDDLYYRIYCGIPGVGMPSHADALKVTDADREQNRNRNWDVVHFVRTIGDPMKRRELRLSYGVAIDR